MFLTFYLTGFAFAASLASAHWMPLVQRDGEDLISCLTSAGLDPITPSDPNYANDTLPLNLRLHYKPSALVYPKNTSDISQAVKCAAAAGTKVNARSGGHSYANFDLGGEDGHLVVSLDNLKQFELNDNLVILGAGQRLGDVALLLWQNDRALAMGTCQGVGIGGHALHGGYGYLSRLHGLLLDQVVELEVVLANGSVVSTSEKENSDLFWAMRGGGPSFGIATKFTLTTVPIPKHATTFAFTYNWTTSALASTAFQTFQQFIAFGDFPPELGLEIRFTQASPVPTWNLNGVWFGEDGPTGLNKTIQPLLDDLAAIGDAKPDMYYEDLNFINNTIYEAGGEAALSVGLDSLNTSIAADFQIPFFGTSVFIKQDALLTNASTESFTNYTYGGVDADVGWYVLFEVFGGKQSKVSQVPKDATSYDARDGLVDIQIVGYAPTEPYPADGLDFTKGIVSSITDPMPDVPIAGYPNYVDSTLSRENAHKIYYPTHTKKLEAIKAAVDPTVVFDFPQGFLPA